MYVSCGACGMRLLKVRDGMGWDGVRVYFGDRSSISPGRACCFGLVIPPSALSFQMSFDAPAVSSRLARQLYITRQSTRQLTEHGMM